MKVNQIQRQGLSPWGVAFILFISGLFFGAYAAVVGKDQLLLIGGLLSTVSVGAMVHFDE